MLVVRDREAGNIMDEVESLEEGQKVIEQFEAEDRENGNYEPDFYEVAEVDPAETPWVQKSSKRIKALRKLTGLSQTKFGEKYGIPMRTIQNWENGYSEAPEYLVDLLEEAVWTDKEEASVRWAFVDATEDQFDYILAASKADALKTAELQWGKMSEYDRKRRMDFYVGLINTDTLDACVISRKWG